MPLLLRYSANAVGATDQRFTFEMVGVAADRQTALEVSASSALPSISKDYRNVFHQKAKSRHPLKSSKTFVVSRNTFEFGPLLVGRARPADGAAAHKENTDSLHISNNGPFPLTVHFSFLNDGTAMHSDIPLVTAVNGAPPVGEADASPPVERTATQPVFFLSTASMELLPGETQDLVVSAYPDCNGIYLVNSASKELSLCICV